MLRGLYASARGMAVESKKQEVISNNLANSNTTGFKKDIVLVRSFSEELLAITGKGQASSLGGLAESPVLQSIATIYSPGMLEETGRDLDLALTGAAFFTLQTPAGIRYTKDGSFGMDRDGFLVSGDGYQVLDVGGRAITLSSSNVDVDEDGEVWEADGQKKRFVAKLGLAVFSAEDLKKLEKKGQNLFEAVAAAPSAQGLGQVRQGMLERANLDIIREMVDMISVMRVYEANQKSLQAQDEILGKSINEVGRLR
ncbi:MAG: flagellar basal-body rod protein FlgF [Dethiobacter sp.]|jgi:flagellar basal-body rod protein FlgG|nr:flagellar basal-body rod protein FlgF [Dethiobacter sp.]